MDHAEYVKKTHEMVNAISEIIATTVVTDQMTLDNVTSLLYDTLRQIDAIAVYPEGVDAMITMDDLKKCTGRPIMFLDLEDGYENRYQCVQYPRLTYVYSGPRSRYWGKPKRKKKGEPAPKQAHQRTFYVDGIECPDLDAVITMLNAEPVAQEEAKHE